jgi:hypothetical protein
VRVEQAVDTARFGVRKVREVYSTEGASGVIRRTRNWQRKLRSRGTEASRLPTGPLPADARWHTGVLVVGEQSLPQCYHYRIEQKREICSQLGIPFDDVSGADAHEACTRLQLASILIVYRLAAGHELDRVVAEARRLRIPVVFEVDDLIYRRDVTAANPNLATLPKGLRSAVIRGSDGYGRALHQVADANLASTQLLADDMTAANGRPGFVVENGIDATMLEIATGLDLEPRPTADDPCVITYGSGSRAHDHDFALAAPGLAGWLAANPEGRLKLIGPVRVPDALQPHTHRIIRIQDTLAYGEYLRELRNSTITIAPLAEDPTNPFKSQVKYLESALVGVPLLASPTVYGNYIDDGRTGVIAATAADWLPALCALTSDESRRTAIASAAREHVRRWELGNRPREQMAELLSALAPIGRERA